MAQLPLYHSTGGKLQYGSSRRGFSFRDRHLLLIILVVFAIICLGSLYYAPEVMEQVSFDATYRKFIGLQDETSIIVADDVVMDDQVSPSKIPSIIQKAVDVVKNDPDGGIDVADVDQDARDLQNEEEVRRNVEEQKEQNEPVQYEHHKEETVEQTVNKEETVELLDNKNYADVENSDSDPLVTQRRNKVKEVRV